MSRVFKSSFKAFRRHVERLLADLLGFGLSVFYVFFCVLIFFPYADILSEVPLRRALQSNCMSGSHPLFHAASCHRLCGVSFLF
jgi:hypothetical protein